MAILFAGGGVAAAMALLQFSLIMISSGSAQTTASTPVTTTPPTTIDTTSVVASSTLSTDITTGSTTLTPTTDSTTGSITTTDSTTSWTSPTSTTTTVSTSATTALTTTDSTPVWTSTATTPSSTTVSTSPIPVTPSPLKFLNISMVVMLNVRETKNKVLDIIACESMNNETVKVSLLNVEPRTGMCTHCFQILPCVPGWCLQYIPKIGTLDISRDPVYRLNITCDNNKGNVIYELTEVRLTVNSPPMFNNSGFFVLHTVQNTKTVRRGAWIYSVSANDTDGDTLHYTMVAKPDNRNFQIGEYDGVIRATNDLSRECSPAVTFEVFVTDRINTPVGPLIISTTLNASNIAPSINNMGGLLQIKEDAAGSVFTIRTVDDEPLTNIRYTLTTVPTQAKMFFNISGQDIVLTSKLDYENPIGGSNRMTLMVEATDLGGCSSGIKTLYVEVTDVNEAPTLVPNTWTATVYEGLITVTPPWKVEDPDYNDVAKFIILTAKTNFTIDPTSGAISYIGDYDVDNPKMSKSVSLSIEVTDRGGKNGTGILNINILDANDNEPVFPAITKPYDVETCTTVGTRIAVLTATDRDSSFQGNNVVYFQIQTSTFFTVLSTGHVFLNSPIQPGDYSSATVYAYDQGLYPGPLRSRSTFLAVNGIPCKTTTVKTTTLTTTTAKTTPTTTPQNTTVAVSKVEYNFMTENLPWMMVAALLGTCFVGLLTFMCCRFARPPCRRHPTSRTSFAEPLKVKSTPPASTYPAQRPDNLSAHPPEKLIPPTQPDVSVTDLEEPKLYDFWNSGINSGLPS